MSSKPQQPPDSVLAAAKGRQMLRDIRQQDEDDQIHEEKIQELQSETLQRNIRTFLILLVIAGAALYYTKPKVLVKLIRRNKLPPRRLLTLVEPGVLQALPPFYGPYAIATPENLEARKSVLAMALLKKQVQNAGRFNQKIDVHSWNTKDFVKQVNDSMDDFCGPGFRFAFDKYESRREDLIIWCLIANGYHDGYVKRTLSVDGILTRGTRGVVAKRIDKEEVLSSFLFLPILTNEQLKDPTKAQPSTLVPQKTLKFLIDVPNDEEYHMYYQHALFKFLQEEKDSFYWFNAACTPEDRSQLESMQRLVATECNSENLSPLCCSIYDPNASPTFTET